MVSLEYGYINQDWHQLDEILIQIFGYFVLSNTFGEQNFQK